MRTVFIFLWAVVWIGCSDDTVTPDSSIGDAARDKNTADALQGPIKIIATNQNTTPVYVDWKWGPRGILSCGLQNAAAWDPCSFFTPGCTEQCSTSNKDKHCCMGCAPPLASVKKLEQGDTVSATWSGAAWETVKDHCADNCSCYWVIQAKSGHYRVEVCVHDAYTCNTTPCPDPNQQGIITDAVPSGTKTCFTAEFDVPYAGSSVDVTIK